MSDEVISILLETAKKLGIKVIETQLSDHSKSAVCGIYTRYEKQDLIFIEQNDSLDEKMFTLAHELGHHILHRHELNNRHFRSYYWSNNEYQLEKEIDADHFAWKLLSFIYQELRNNKKNHRGYFKIPTF